MNVRIAAPHAIQHEALDTVIVIDVLRATTTASILAQRSSQGLLLLAEPAHLAELPGPPSGYVVFSEVDFDTTGYTRVDNSPALALAIELGDRMPVLITTNGTRAVGAVVGRTRRLLLGSFTNAPAMVELLMAPGPADDVCLVPAGNVRRAEARFEDDQCATVLQALLAGLTIDAVALAGECRRDARLTERLRKEDGLERDVDLALSVGSSNAVPELVSIEGKAMRFRAT